MVIGGINIEREKDKRLQQLFDSGKQVYSFSKLSSIENCPYGAYLSYILHQQNKKDSVWGVLGGKFHDKLEQIINKEAEPDELVPIAEEEVEYLDMLGMEFPKDYKGGDSIRNNWIANMQHFSDTYKQMPLEGNFETEELVILKIDDDHYIQGYVDLVRHNEDGSISILDWKTSSMYSKEDFKHAAHQLKIYGLAKEAQGFKISSLHWIFLKYVDVEFDGYERANSKQRKRLTKTVERRKLGKELRNFVLRDMLSSGYGKLDAYLYVDKLVEHNSLDVLPEDIRRNYKLKLCVVDAEFTEEEKQKTLDWVNEIIELYETYERKGVWPTRDFTKINKFGKEVEDTFFCNNLCSYGHSCKYIALFNEAMRKKNNEDDEFDDLF